MKRFFQLSVVLSLGFLFLQTCYSQSLKKLSDQRLTLPNGWSLTPAGSSFPLGDLPLNMALAHHHPWAAVTLNGYGKEGVKIFDLKRSVVVDSVFLPSAWVGLAFGAEDRLIYASGGNENKIYVLARSGHHWSKTGSIALGRPWAKDKISPAGLTVDAANNRLYTVTKEDSALYVVNLQQKKVVQRIKLPAAAYTCLQSKDGKELYISLWGGGNVAVYDIGARRISAKIPVEDHPNDMALSPNGRFLYVANANANSVTVIDTHQQKVIENLNAALYPHAPTGSTTNSVALSTGGDTLYTANADNNCLAVFDVSDPGESRSLGYIPTGWYPTSVKTAGNRIIVANGKGGHSMANPNGPNPGRKRTSKTQYIAGLLKGTLSIITPPEHQQMARFSKAVYKNTPYQPSKNAASTQSRFFAAADRPSPIKHVFYIIKENRTYDQVLGDMPQGNGDSTLTLFGRHITPNHHKLARNFVLLDNFYVDAEVSADGHNWSTAAYATDYVEKTWPTYYSGRGGNYDYEGGRKIAFPQKGFIWNYCKRAGISYRSYGEFADLGNAHLKVLKGHIDRNYPGFDLSVSDTLREKRWEHDFDSLLARNAVPQFQTIRLPNDHTSGAQPGRPTPDAYAADNDWALGRLIDHLSHSRIWKNSIVFVVEDDAQNGPDHVDAHRSVALVAGPSVKRHKVVHTMYSTSSVLRTMELILGLPPMSQYDAAATPMADVFATKPDTTAYTSLPNNVELDKMNKADASLIQETQKFNLARADAAPDLAFNRVIWKTMRGKNSTMPAPRHSAFLKVKKTSDSKSEEEEAP